MDKVIWAGVSGIQYEFEVYPVGQEFLPVSGVYAFCRPLWLLVGYEALYVGETESLQNRLNTGLLNHDGYERALREGCTHVAAMRTYDEAYRLSVETDLRHSLDPVCNQQDVPTLLSGLGMLFNKG